MALYKFRIIVFVESAARPQPFNQSYVLAHFHMTLVSYITCTALVCLLSL